MLSGVSILCFAASYAVALVLELSRLLFRSGIRGAAMLGFAGAGLLAHSAFLYYRAREATAAGSSPLCCEKDWYLLAAWALVATYLFLVYYHPRVPFGLFLLPLALVLIAVAAWAADAQPFTRGQASRTWGITHGVSIVLAAVAVLIGFTAGLMYLWQAWRLKQKRPPWGGLRLPSLEWLQRTNSRALVVSVVMLGIGVVSGLILNLIPGRENREPLPWHDPVVLSTQVMFAWLLLALVLGAVYKPARQGRKVAYFTVVSFVLLVLALGAGLLTESRHWRSEEKSEARGQRSEVGCRDQGASICNLQSEICSPSPPSSSPGGGA
jgi:ABC-type uncharacterized transport system permease subunit